MIDQETETLLTPARSCKEFPGGVGIATVWRYMSKGVRGVKLEYFVCGGKRWTSKEAISRFVDAQNTDQTPAPPAITPAQRRRQSEAARAELERAGI